MMPREHDDRYGISEQLRDELRMTVEGRTRLKRLEFLGQIDDALRAAEEQAFGQRARLLEQGIEEHLADHLAVNLIAQLSGLMISRFVE